MTFGLQRKNSLLVTPALSSSPGQPAPSPHALSPFMYPVLQLWDSPPNVLLDRQIPPKQTGGPTGAAQGKPWRPISTQAITQVVDNHDIVLENPPPQSPSESPSQLAPGMVTVSLLSSPTSDCLPLPVCVLVLEGLSLSYSLSPS